MKEALKLALEALEDPVLLNGVNNAKFFINQALAQPPQRTWVGLTEERIKEIWSKGKDHGDDWADVLALARAFEAELKEKNT